jgi:hypothetical protein
VASRVDEFIIPALAAKHRASTILLNGNWYQVDGHSAISNTYMPERLLQNSNGRIKE